MDSANSGPLDSSELRVALVRELSRSLARSQSALLARHLPEFESHTVRQAELCSQIVCLSDSTNPFSPEFAAAAAGLRFQLQVYAALLRRARRTVEIFCRALANCGPTYPIPHFARDTRSGRS